MSRPPVKTSSRARPLPVKMTLEGGNQQLANLCGPLDVNLRQIADGLDLELTRQGNRLTIRGAHAEAASKMLFAFHDRAAQQALSVDDIQLGLVEIGVGRSVTPTMPNFDPSEFPPLDDESGTIALRTRRSDLRPRTPRQRDYLNNILKSQSNLMKLLLVDA